MRGIGSWRPPSTWALNSLGYDGHNLYLKDQYCRPEIFQEKVVFNFPVNQCGTSRKVDCRSGRRVTIDKVPPKAWRRITTTPASRARGCSTPPWTSTPAAASTGDGIPIQGFSQPGPLRPGGPEEQHGQLSGYFPRYLRGLPILRLPHDNLLPGAQRVRAAGTLWLSHQPTTHERGGSQSYVSGSSRYARFSFKAFQFLRRADQVYIRCKVLICQDNDWNSRCRRGCVKRRNRDAGARHKSRTLVLGPIRLIDPDKKEKGSAKEDAG